jgi:acetyl esterase
MNRRLDPDAQALLDVMSAAGLPALHTLTVEQARERMRTAFVAKGELAPLDHVENVSIPTPSGGLGLRLYRPSEGILPVAIFLHGGGWTVNDLDTHDRLCRLISRRSGWLLVSLNYRRAPEHKHPSAVEDAYFGYRWLLDNAGHIGGDTQCRAIVGESSGGTIAASLMLLLRDAGAPMPTYQILAYPATDLHDRWPSYQERGTGYTLDRDQLLWFFGHYLPKGYDPEDPYLFPMTSRNLSGLPSTLVMTSEYDPLRDEGRAYAERLAGAGVSVEHVHADDQMHGFLLLDRAVPRAGKLIEFLADALASHATERASRLKG